MAWPIVAAAAITTAGSIYGANKAANAAQAQADAQNEATIARHQYDLDMWDMKKQQLQAARQDKVDLIMESAINEGRGRAYKDNAANQEYQYALQIRNRQQQSNELAYQRSDDIFTDQTNLNSITAKAAMDNEIVKLEEVNAQARFDQNDAYLEMLQAEGQLRARAAGGRSSAKGYQATMADYGKQMGMLNATLDSNDRNARSMLEEIIRDKGAADLTAFASKMLDPGVLPMPIKPEALPEPVYSLPRVLEEYEFGPQPIRGAMADAGAARAAIWGNAVANIAGTIGGAVSNPKASWNE